MAIETDFELGEVIVILGATIFIGYVLVNGIEGLINGLKSFFTGVVPAIDKQHEDQVAASGEPCQKGRSACDPSACNKPNYCTVPIGTNLF